MTASLFVNDASVLESLAAQLQAAPAFALDTEFMRERTYYPQLCLVQLAGADLIACIDPLAIEDLGSLDALLAQSDAVKVVHAVRQDLEALLTRLARAPTRLFDTQVAAALIGLSPQIGYGDLVQRFCGVALDKTHARTDWAARPLAPAQLRYASDDVRYLLPLRDALTAELDRRGRRTWFDTEMIRHASAGTRRIDPDEAWQRLRGLEGMDARRRETAKALARWREERAIRRNRPRGWILSDDALHDIVRALPEDRAAFERLESLPRGLLEKSGEELAGVVQSTARLNATARPQQRERPDAEQQRRLKHLAATVRRVAEQLDLSPELLATRRELQQLLGGNRDIEPLRGWRRDVIGDVLLQAL
ncbi:MAG TPA: ribonuclease D [Steroidobacteraceae bacterium]|nr:ribonuclease D [Steroidobacteraceae bacterium]